MSVIWFHGDGGEGEVCAVESDHGGLADAGFGVVVLDCGGDGDCGYGDHEEEVEGYGGDVHVAAAGGEVDVHDDGHDEGGEVHEEGAADEEGLPEAQVGGFGVVDFVLTVLGPGVGEVD